LVVVVSPRVLTRDAYRGTLVYDRTAKAYARTARLASGSGSHPRRVTHLPMRVTRASWRD